MFFWNSLAFLMIQQMLAIWSLVLLPSSLNIWKFMVCELLKPGLENFEYYFASMCDECNCPWRPRGAPERHGPVSRNGTGESWHLQWKCFYSRFWSPEMAALGTSEELLPDILLPRPPDFIRSTMQSPKQSHTISQHHMGKAPAETVFHSCSAPKAGTADPL